MIRFLDLSTTWSAQRVGDTHGIRTAPASQSIAICLKAADPIFSFSSVQISPFSSGVKTLAWGQLLEGVPKALSVACQKWRYVVTRKTIKQNITTPIQIRLLFCRWDLGAGYGDEFEDGRIAFSFFVMDEDIWLWETMQLIAVIYLTI